MRTVRRSCRHGCRRRCPPALLLPLLLILLHIVPIVHGETFNFEVGKRIHERVSAFMSAPPDILLQTSLLRANGMFPADLRAPDRDAFFRLNDAFMETYPQFQSIYFGLEDGVFGGHGFNSKIANYREPGHSGYVIADAGDGADGRAEDPNMEKHYGACVDSTSGEGRACTMKDGGKYTECTAMADPDEVGALGLDCTLVKCADESSQRDCDALTNETEREACASEVKWCSSYTIEEAAANVTRGYISRSTYCIDRSGIPTQEEGNVVIKGQQELGNCYFDDGTTLVQRDVAGDFAYCGGNGHVCNDTLAGARASRDYDPRWRGWYIATKALQKPNWSPPYPFFSTLETGITFNRPIYTVQDDGRNVFAGVLAVDYTFVDISRFLQESYKDSPTVVAIVEQAEPHYMIASSTGSNNAKVVLADDETRPCPNPGAMDGTCKAVRIKVSELRERDADRLIANAFARQRARGFLEDELLSAKASDGALYAAQSKSFSIDGDRGDGFEWTILVMTPTETEGADEILPGEMLFAGLIAVAVLGAAICCILVGLIVRNRTKREIIVSDWRFLSAFVGGCALVNLSCLTFLGPNTDELCLLRMWAVHFFVAFALSLLFVKVYRMYLLVGKGPRRNTISHGRAAKMALPLIVLQSFVLLIFTFVDPNRRQEEIVIEGGEIVHRFTCGHDTPAFFIVMLVIEGGLVLVGCVLAFQTRHLRDEFNESKQIILAMYDTAVIGSILLIVSNVVVEYQGEQRMLFAVGIFWTTCFASAVFVLPRLMQVRDRRGTRPRNTVRVTGLGQSSVMGRPSALSSSEPQRSTVTQDSNVPNGNALSTSDPNGNSLSTADKRASYDEWAVNE